MAGKLCQPPLMASQVGAGTAAARRGVRHRRPGPPRPQRTRLPAPSRRASGGLGHGRPPPPASNAIWATCQNIPSYLMSTSNTHFNFLNILLLPTASSFKEFYIVGPIDTQALDSCRSASCVLGEDLRPGRDLVLSQVTANSVSGAMRCDTCEQTRWPRLHRGCRWAYGEGTVDGAWPGGCSSVTAAARPACPRPHPHLSPECCRVLEATPSADPSLPLGLRL